jgi:hypothetical protein
MIGFVFISSFAQTEMHGVEFRFLQFVTSAKNKKTIVTGFDMGAHPIFGLGSAEGKFQPAGMRTIRIVEPIFPALKRWAISRDTDPKYTRRV